MIAVYPPVGVGRMRFGLLGPLVVEVGGREVAVQGNRDRVVLALLLLGANEVVTTERLVDAVWPHSPPPTARAQIHSCVSRLRAALTPESGERDIIHSQAGGYLLSVAPDQLDLITFHRDVTAAREAANGGRLTEADTRYEQALTLWRGSALTGVTSPVLQSAAVQLDERRLEATEEHLDVQLRLGHRTQLVSQLQDLVAQYPLRERFCAQLMLALHRNGRSADALTVYRRTRQHLADELGIEPATELVELHYRILNRDPALLPTKPPSTEPVPHTLPRDIGDFTGRDDLITEIRSLIELASERTATAPTIISIDGMAGVGKTSLALRVAHLVIQRFPDARLYLDLHGHSERAPLEPAAALDTLLRQLGVPGERIPQGLEERVSLWRGELAHRQALILLDNAADTHQVAPLLPTGPGCLALVTSRRRLLGLDGARTVSLRTHSDQDAVALLERIVGERVAAARPDGAELARMCGNLALALRLAAARLVHRPGWQVADLIAYLRNTAPVGQRFSAEGRTVAAAFALSYEHLTPAAQRLFRLLGLHPGADIDADAATALADQYRTDTNSLLDELLDSHLVQEPQLGRYWLHDLMKDYAHELAMADETEEERAAALRRLVDFFTRRMAGVVEHFPISRRLHEFMPADKVLSFTEPEAAHRWIRDEYPNLLSVIRCASRLGWHTETCNLVRAVWWHQYECGYHDDCLETHGLALRAADATGDQAVFAQLLNNRASAHFIRGRWPEALADVQQAADVARACSHVGMEARSLNNTAKVLRRLGHYKESRAAALRAAELFNAYGDTQSHLNARLEAEATTPLMRQFPEGLREARALVAFGRTMPGLPYAQTVAHLGWVELARGCPRVAILLLCRSLRLVGPQGRVAAVEATLTLGAAYREIGDFDASLHQLSAALDTMRTLQDRPWESETRCAIAATFAASGDRGAALDQYRQALSMVEHTDARLEQARAMDGLAGVLDSTDPVASQMYLRRALAMYEELGLPDQEEIRERLRLVESRAVDPLLGTVGEDLPLPHG